MRQIAEVVRFAHDKKVVHRGLCPQSILVTDPATPHPRIKILNWQVGYREGSATSKVSQEVCGDVARGPAGRGRDHRLHGAGGHRRRRQPRRAPRRLLARRHRLSPLLRRAAGGQWSRAEQQAARNQGAADQLGHERCREEPPGPGQVRDPSRGHQPDRLGRGLPRIPRSRRGRAHRTRTQRCRRPDASPEGRRAPRRIHRPEAPRPGGLLHRPARRARRRRTTCSRPRATPSRTRASRTKPRSSRSSGTSTSSSSASRSEIGEHAGFLMRPVLVDKSENRVETLGQRLRKEGRLHIDHLQRFGDDLLDVVNYLQEQGIAHRDIKPDNIAVGMVGRGDTLHVVLFDFSLSRTPTENIRAGTTGYLDPLLPLRKPPRWDLHAERYAAAATLHELATGTLPRWGDGTTDPSHLDCEITIDAELFDASLRERLSEFFRKAFRRDVSQRFDNAEEMLREWRHCFEDIEAAGGLLRPRRRGDPARSARRRDPRHSGPRAGPGHPGHQRPRPGEPADGRRPAHRPDAAALAVPGRGEQDAPRDRHGGPAAARTAWHSARDRRDARVSTRSRRRGGIARSGKPEHRPAGRSAAAAGQGPTGPTSPWR